MEHETSDRDAELRRAAKKLKKENRHKVKDGAEGDGNKKMKVGDSNGCEGSEAVCGVDVGGDGKKKSRHQKQPLEQNSDRKPWRKIHKKNKPQREEKLLEQLKQFQEQQQQKISSEGCSKNVSLGRSIGESDKIRQCTVTVALPGSILNNAQSLELRSYLAGQIARAMAVFCVNEVVIFDELARLTDSGNWPVAGAVEKDTDCNFELARILQYLECPQYLRRTLFPLQRVLKFAGVLNPLDCPHHLRADDFSIPYREAVVLGKPCKDGHGSYCDAGIYRDVQVDRKLPEGLRVTLKLPPAAARGQKRIEAELVSPSEPLDQLGIYWGYTVRVAKSLGYVLHNSPYEHGYDLTVGTSERGQPIDSMDEYLKCKHVLVVFGGLSGLESCLEADEQLEADEPSSLFNCYVNVLPNQGSRTIRTEEALLIALGSLRPKLGL